MSVNDFLSSQRRSKDSSKISRVGIAGFVAYAPINSQFEWTSEAPTTYLENGSSVEDTIVLNPVSLTIEGVVADIYLTPEVNVTTQSSSSINVGNINIYQPLRSETETQKINSILSDANDAVDEVGDNSNFNDAPLNFIGDQSQDGNLKEQFIAKMETLHFSKQVCSIELPSKTFDNMRITAFSARQDNQTDEIRFNISAQEIRIAENQTSAISESLANPATGLNGQSQGETDKGTQEGEPADKSLLSVFLGD